MATTHRVPGAVITERAHSVPLDHSQPDGEKITVFTRRGVSDRSRFIKTEVLKCQPFVGVEDGTYKNASRDLESDGRWCLTSISR